MTVEESISCYYTETRYGRDGAGREREVSQDARWRSACTELVRGARASYSFESFYCESLGSCFLWDDSQTRKKKKKHSYEYFFLDEFDWLNCIEAVQERFCVCDNYAVFCEIFDECF